MLTCNRRKNFSFPFKELGEKISVFLLIFNGFCLYINVMMILNLIKIENIT